MTSFWKIVASVTCVAVVCGAAITWLVHERRLKEAARVYRLSAEQGDAKAQTKLGTMYIYGRGVPKDYAEALRLYRKSADQGDAGGQYGIGLSYFHGQGVPKDDAEAVRWYQKAADQGYAKAQYNLGYMYYHGYGIQQSNTEAALWYRKAADQGYALAESGIGFMEYYGYGVPQNRAEADRWYHKAADQGDDYAQRFLGLKGPKLSRWNIINYSIVPLGCLILLIGPLSHGWRLQDPHHRAVALAALLGLFVHGMSLYWVFGVLPSISAVNAFFFAKNLLAGIFVAMIIILILPMTAKIALGIFGIFFIGFNVVAIAHHDLASLAPAIRLFCTVYGMFIGISIPLAIFLWRSNKNSGGEQNGNREGAASENAAE
jgi:hypothetical protein